MIATETEYNFVRIKVHPRLDLTAWYLAIKRADLDLFFEMHRRSAQSMFMRFHHDPHLYNQKTWEPLNEIAQILNPVRLSAGWLATAEKALLEFGVIYMNRAYGLLFGPNEVVVETLILPTLEFPIDDNSKDGVQITISLWGCGQHYYLSSNQNHVFPRDKYDTYAQAMSEAGKHAYVTNINFRIEDSYREGD